jgi:glycosyltransferase involved in cell wall biosynthesis
VTVCAVLRVRDEADIIVPTVTHLLDQGIDRVLVADNLSVDGTRTLLEDLRSDRVTVIEDDEVGYYQDVRMTALARQAAAMFDAEWILPVDADELWYWPHGTLAEFFATTPDDVVVGTGWDHIATDDDDPTATNPYLRIRHRRLRPQRLGKIGFRWHPDAWIDYGNHDVFNHPGRRGNGLLYRHYQYRTFEQMCRKVRQGKDAYDATDLHATYGAHWRELGGLDDGQLWARWRRLCEEPGLIDDPAR